MNIAVRVTRSATLLALALPVAAAAQSPAQYTGVSRPDDTPITNTEPATQPAPLAPSLKPRPGIPMEAAPSAPSAPAPTFTVVGPAVPTFGAAPVSSGTVPVTLADPDGGIVSRLPGPSNVLPVGTLVNVRLAQEISTASTHSGTTFTAQLTEPVLRDGRVLLPAGSTLSGLVTDIHGGKRISGAASIHLRTVAVTLPDGTRYAFRGQVIDTSLFREVKVGSEGTILRRDHAGKTAATFALTDTLQVGGQ